MKFKVNDKISIYNVEYDGIYGFIKKIEGNYLIVTIKEETVNKDIVVHYKQCRKLKKKSEQILYAVFNGSCFLGASLNNGITLCKNDYIKEFIERKKK